MKPGILLSLGLGGVATGLFYLAARGKRAPGQLSPLPTKRLGTVLQQTSEPVSDALKEARRREELRRRGAVMPQAQKPHDPVTEVEIDAPVYRGPPPPPPDGLPPLSPEPKQILTEEIPLVPGREYLVAVNINNKAVRAIASSKDVRSQASKRGFTVALASDKGPPNPWGVGWPRIARTHWYVLGRYDGPAPTKIGRSHGVVSLVDVWVK